MENMPMIKEFADKSKGYQETCGPAKVVVYTPAVSHLTEVVNFGFRAPFLMVFTEEVVDEDSAKAYAESEGLDKIAQPFGTGICFIRPASGSFADAKPGLYEDVIANARIAQYYKDGVTLGRNRFTGEWGRSYIRGGVQRAYVIGRGIAGDYVAKNLLKTLEGDGLYGKGDITPAVVTLVNVTQVPQIERADIPVISVLNEEKINDVISEKCNNGLIENSIDYKGQFDRFGKLFHRMVGNLIEEPDFDEIDFQMEPGIAVLKTSPDNVGDDKGTAEHEVGYVAYYNKEIVRQNKKVPLVMCFHGGGDSAMCMASVSGWYAVAHKYNFLLVGVENHLDSTATEMQELIAKLKTIYPVDETKIYSTGFSMGGCKSWDMMQEYPTAFAAIAPMDATFEVGLNSYGKEAPAFHKDVPLPVFYVGGAKTPLPELPFQAQKCLDRMNYVLEVNGTDKKNPYTLEELENWEDPIYGIPGDETLTDENPERPGSILTMELFKTGEKCLTVFGSVSDQQHEVRMHTCDHAYRFMNLFSRKADGTLEGGAYSSVKEALS